MPYYSNFDCYIQVFALKSGLLGEKVPHAALIKSALCVIGENFSQNGPLFWFSHCLPNCRECELFSPATRSALVHNLHKKIKLSGIASIVFPIENGSIHYFDILNPSCSKLIIKTMLKKSTLGSSLWNWPLSNHLISLYFKIFLNPPLLGGLWGSFLQIQKDLVI